jgi:N-acyl-D-aspartate/D-glutamate deacylase
MSRTVFSGGLVFDGTGAAPSPGDVAVEDGRIADVGAGLDGDERVDCGGRAVCPDSSTATFTSWQTAISTR